MKYEEMDDLVDDTLLNPDYDPEADALPEGGIDELVKFMDEDEDEPDDDFGFPDSEVTKGNLIVGEDIKKSQPGPMDVHTAVGMFVTKKKKRKKIGKSFDEIYKAAKSGYGPGKNPNSHKRVGGHVMQGSRNLASRSKATDMQSRDAKQYIKEARRELASGNRNAARLNIERAKSLHASAKDNARNAGPARYVHGKVENENPRMMARVQMERARNYKAKHGKESASSYVRSARNWAREARSIGKSVTGIEKARKKSMYGPGKNPNSHKGNPNPWAYD